jgi:YesN/AraC family two-component response regulator
LNENIKYCSEEERNEKSFYYDHVHIVWNEQISLHQSPEWELSYIIKGSGTRIVGNRVETFSKGEVVLLPPNIPHGWYFDEFDHDEEGKIENITIIFPTDLLTKCENTFPETRSCISQIKLFKQAITFQGESRKALQKVMTQMSSQNNMEQLSSLLKIFEIIAFSAETCVVGNLMKQNKSALKMQEVSRFIVHNYQNKITLDEVAQHFGMNRTSFCSFFKREKGKSFFSALNEYRIECSCLMLRGTTMPIANICHAVGFDDVPYFNRTFRKLKGLSPKEYRS